jgi:hypothetical protein
MQMRVLNTTFPSYKFPTHMELHILHVHISAIIPQISYDFYKRFQISRKFKSFVL